MQGHPKIDMPELLHAAEADFLVWGAETCYANAGCLFGVGAIVASLLNDFQQLIDRLK